MPTSYSPNKNFQLQATGEDLNTWGINLNSNFSLIDENLGGTLNISVAGSSNVNLTLTQAANLIHNLSGALTGNINYNFPANGGVYAISNQTSGAYTVTVTVQGGSGGIVVPQGTTSTIYIDATTSAVESFTGTQYVFQCGTVGGTANALTVSQTFPSNFSLNTGTLVTFTPTSLNTASAPTLNINGTGAKTLQYLTPIGLGNLPVGYLPTAPVIAQYTGTTYDCLNIPYFGVEKSSSTNQNIGLSNLFQSLTNTAALTYTIAQSTALPPFWYVEIIASGGAVTITPNGSDAINVNGRAFSAGTSYVLPQGASGRLGTDSNGNLYFYFNGHRLNTEASLASATTCDLGSAGSNIIDITGTTTITSFGSSASAGNPFYITRFAGALTLTYNSTSLIIPGAASYTTSAGDVFMWKYEGSGNWRCVGYALISGKALAVSSIAIPGLPITGFLPSSISSSSNTSCTMTIGSSTAGANSCMDSTGATSISSNSSFSWSVANGNAINGYQGGTTLPSGSTIHFFICSGATGTGTFASTSLTPTLPSGYNSAYRRIFSLFTNGSGVLLGSVGSNLSAVTDVGGGAIAMTVNTQILDSNGGSLSGTAALITLSVPGGIQVEPLFRCNATGSNAGIIITSPGETDVAPATQGASWTAVPGYDFVNNFENMIVTSPRYITNTSSQLRFRATGSCSLYLVTRGWIDYRRS